MCGSGHEAAEAIGMNKLPGPSFVMEIEPDGKDVGRLVTCSLPSRQQSSFE